MSGNPSRSGACLDPAALARDAAAGGPYDVIAADPPWQHDSTPGGGRGAAVNHYRTMGVDEISAMWPAIYQLAARPSLLALWCPDSMMREGLQVMRSWGYEYLKIGFVWVKTTRTRYSLGGPEVRERIEAGEPMVWDLELEGDAVTAYARGLKMGLGRTTRSGAEFCLFGRLGRMLPVEDRGVAQVFLAPLPGLRRGEHSRKPEIYMERLERMWPAARRLELFGRRRRRGWMVWGDEVP